jgi:hypothetical protein
MLHAGFTKISVQNSNSRGKFEIPHMEWNSSGEGNSKCSVHTLQKSLYGIQTAGGNSKFPIWNETAGEREIQNALCIFAFVRKNSGGKFSPYRGEREIQNAAKISVQRREIQNSPYGMKQRRARKFKMLCA